MLKFINGNVFIDNRIIPKEFVINDEGKITFEKLDDKAKFTLYDLNGLTVLPGFVDIHIHTRNPGFTQKENLKNLNNSLLFGGYTHALAQPNVLPFPDSIKSIKKIQKLLDDNLTSNVIQVGKITKKDKTIKNTKYWKYIKFASDDGLPVKRTNQMLKALKLSKKFDVQLLLHEEDETIKGYAYESNFSRKFNILSFDSKYETNMITRDIGLNRKINAKIHIQHISTLEGLIIYKRAQDSGMNISAELTPHHITLDNSMLPSDNGLFKVNPPLPTPTSRKALLESFKDETIGIIATDHAPHSLIDKKGGFQNAASGFIGLESTFGLINKLIQTYSLSINTLVNAMSINPGKLMGVDNTIYENNLANLTVVNLNEKWIFDKNNIKSKNFNSPFINNNLIGRVKMVIVNGKPILLQDKKEKI